MLNKIIALLLACYLVFLPTIALADESLVPPNGKITGLRYKQPAPYSGVLLNSVAAAKLLAEKSFSEEQWKLKLQYELAKQAATLSLTIETQKVTYGALEKKHTTLMKIKDGEIKRLAQIASNTNDYSVWWASGGVLVGISLTIAVVYAVEARK